PCLPVVTFPATQPELPFKRRRSMKRRWLLVLSLFLFLGVTARPAAAEHRFVVRSTLGLSGLQRVCLLNACTVLRTLDGTLGQLFLVTTSDLVDPNLFLSVLRLVPGIADAEIDRLFVIGSGLASVTTIPTEFTETNLINYFGTQV